MIKQNIRLATIALVLATLLGAAPASAIEVDEIDCIADPTNEICLATTSEEDTIMPISEPTDCLGGSDVEDCATVTPNITEENGNKPTDPVRDYDYPTEEIENADIEEETTEEPALWPMYLSLGALGLALLVFIILNLFGGKKRK